MMTGQEVLSIDSGTALVDTCVFQCAIGGPLGIIVATAAGQSIITDGGSSAKTPEPEKGGQTEEREAEEYKTEMAKAAPEQSQETPPPPQESKAAENAAPAEATPVAPAKSLHTQNTVETPAPAPSKVSPAEVSKPKPHRMPPGLDADKAKEYRKRVKNRTLKKEEWKKLQTENRFKDRRERGIDDFWIAEKERILNNEPHTVKWEEHQIKDILAPGKAKPGKPKDAIGGKTIQGHHKYSAREGLVHLHKDNIRSFK